MEPPTPPAVLPFDTRSKLYDWLFRLQELPQACQDQCPLAAVIDSVQAERDRLPWIKVGYTVEYRENYLIRIVDCPFEILEAYYTKANSLIIESAQFIYAFDEDGYLQRIQHNPSDEEVWDNSVLDENMVSVDSFQELRFFEEFKEEDFQRRMVGVKFFMGNRTVNNQNFELVIDIDPCLGHCPIEGVAKTNIEDNLKSFRDDDETMPLAIVAGRDILLYPENIHLARYLPGVGKVGWGSALYAGSRVVAIYRQ